MMPGNLPWLLGTPFLDMYDYKLTRSELDLKISCGAEQFKLMTSTSKSLSTTPLSLKHGSKQYQGLRVGENEEFTHVATCMVEGYQGELDVLPGQASIVGRDEEGVLWVRVHLVNTGDETIDIEVDDMVGTCMPLVVT
jgi:hypothetical protein